jgi:hypothetical protein
MTWDIEVSTTGIYDVEIPLHVSGGGCRLDD